MWISNLIQDISRTSHLWRYQIIIPEWRKEDVLAVLAIDKLAVEINGEDTISPG